MLSFTNCFSWQNYLQAQLKFRICSNCSLQGRHLRAKLYCSADKASCLSPSWLRTSRVGLVWLVPLLCPAPCDLSFERSLAGYKPWSPKRVGHDWATIYASRFFPVTGRHKILSIAPSLHSSSLCHLVYIQQCVHTDPKLLAHLSPHPRVLFGNHKHVFYVCDSTSAL